MNLLGITVQAPALFIGDWRVSATASITMTQQQLQRLSPPKQPRPPKNDNRRAEAIALTLPDRRLTSTYINFYVAVVQDPSRENGDTYEKIKHIA
jgi:hypothetical protein